jgi:hypothetical protein
MLDTLPAEGQSADDVTPEASSTSTEVQAESSPAGESAESTFSQTVDRLEKGEKPAAGESPPTETEPESSAADEAMGETDEPPKAKPEADDKVLSQSDDEVLRKSFSTRPEWKKALDLVPDEKKHAMRKALQPILLREQRTLTEIERLKPAGDRIERLRKAVGDDGVENTIVLVEGWQHGDENAEKVLENLLQDLRARRGTVLGDKDLVDESEDLDRRVAEGEIEAEQAEKRRRELSELQKHRAESKRVQVQAESSAQEQAKARVERIVQDRTTAINDWEKQTSSRDADYPKLQKLVVDRARRLADEKQSESQQLLSPAEMVKVLQESYESVKSELGHMLPKPQKRTPITGGGSSLTSRAKPKDDTEAFFQRIEQLEAAR